MVIDSNTIELDGFISKNSGETDCVEKSYTCSDESEALSQDPPSSLKKTVVEATPVNLNEMVFMFKIL